MTSYDVQPVRRPDGLVAERPDSFRDGDRYVRVDYDDPMLDSYRWVAMLDPAELAAGTTVSDLSAGEHRGRPAWMVEDDDRVEIDLEILAVDDDPVIH